jgi:hypothetical protein
LLAINLGSRRQLFRDTEDGKVSIDQFINARIPHQLLVGLLLAVNTVAATAMPTFARQYKLQYGYTPSCQACHREGGGTPLTTYGQAFMDSGKNSAAFSLIAEADSDNDGYSNAQESVAKANPADKTSVPGSTGMWLDLSSVIPREVQALFPDATAWKPLDANLTPGDITAAQELGVSLTSEDENTIYIPVAERRPIGTALIFPSTYNDGTVFLLMATDRQLNISQITVLNADEQPEVRDSKVLVELRGTAVQSVPPAEGDSLDASIARAVQKAGVLIYLRLKGA